jgi:hypothetical protein
MINRITIIPDDEKIFGIEVASGFKVSECNYGYDISEEGFAEWEVAIRYTGRQDSKVSWGVVLTSIDGLVTFKGGLSKEAMVHIDIQHALTETTTDARWINPL